jgi:hypothetical protein
MPDVLKTVADHLFAHCRGHDHIAPEQAMAKEIGPWTDLYSVV